jgi:hypothetical protein
MFGLSVSAAVFHLAKSQWTHFGLTADSREGQPNAPFDLYGALIGRGCQYGGEKKSPLEVLKPAGVGDGL